MPTTSFKRHWTRCRSINCGVFQSWTKTIAFSELSLRRTWRRARTVLKKPRQWFGKYQNPPDELRYTLPYKRRPYIDFFGRRPAQNSCSASLDTGSLCFFHLLPVKALDSVSTRVYKKKQDTSPYHQPRHRCPEVNVLNFSVGVMSQLFLSNVPLAKVKVDWREAPPMTVSAGVHLTNKE